MPAKNLSEILRERSCVDTKGITFIEGSDREEFYSYQNLYADAVRALAYLQASGITPADELVFQVADNKTFIIVFWACVLGGIIPVPLSVGNNDDHRQKLYNIWPVLTNPYLVISGSNNEKLKIFAASKGLDESYAVIASKIIDEAGVITSQAEGKLYDVKEDTIAFVQFSSGSTGSPKGVILTHRNLIANMEAISNAARYSPADATISWMPLTHDMGLIGFHLNPLFSKMNQYLLPTPVFIRRPDLWLEKTSQYKISILCSPNFGYKYFLKHCNDIDNYNWDLSPVRILYNGAEPISEKLCKDFLNRLAGYGLKTNCMCPVYGLAEATLAVSISGLEDEVNSLALDRTKLNVGDTISLKNDNENSVAFVNVGKVIDNCSIRITGNDNVVAANATIGNVEIKGVNVTTGYYNNEAETTKIISRDGWLKTGDLGFINDDALYITGRSKDIIFVNGQNYYPHDIERAAEESAYVELNKIAVAGLYNNKTGKDEVIAFIFHRGDLESFIPVVKSVKALVNTSIGFEIDRVIPVKDIPRTTSGKLQRFKLLEQYRDGLYKEVEEKLNEVINKEAADELNTGKPVNEYEQKLMQIWQRVLNIHTITVNQRFFETGGSSLKAAEMAMLLMKEMQVELSMDVLYEKQTIRELARELNNLHRRQYVPIPAIKKSNYYPVSPAQKRIYYSWQLDKNSTGYNIPVAIQVNGEPGIRKLEDCIWKLVLRHEALRTSFHMKDEPVCKVHEITGFEIDYVECNSSELDEQLRKLIQPFNLAEQPLVRCTLLKLQAKEYIIFLDFHHIISDGLSVYNFIDELMKIYGGHELPVLPVQYKEYVNWNYERLQTATSKMQEAYWLKQLEGELPVLELPADYQRPAIVNNRGEKLLYRFDKETTTRLRELAKNNQCTLHVLLFTLYNLLLSKYTGQEDIIIGIPVAGRRHPDVQLLQGMFVNNLPVRSVINGDECFTQMLEKQKRNIADGLNNQDYSFDQLIQKIPDKSDVSRNPLFDTMFIYQDMGFPEIQTNQLAVSRYFFDPGFSKFDISMEVYDEGDSILYGIEYCTALFKRGTIGKMAGHFENLVQNVLKNTGSKLSALNVISEEEYEAYTGKFNVRDQKYSTGKTIHRLIEEQVQKNAGSVAIEFKDEKITYARLNEKADHLAALLNEKGTIANKPVAVLLPRSPELIISILGILKAGGCFLPIDVDLPVERIKFILKDSQCDLLLTNTLHRQTITNSNLSIINIDRQEIFSQTLPVNQNDNATNDLAYIIYTSGTTGNPKGVMIGHQSLVNYISWAAGQYIKEGAGFFPLFTSISFDLTITSIFTPLVTGNRIVIYEEEGNTLLLGKVIDDNKIDIIKLTPSHLKIMAESKWPVTGSRVKVFIVGGEQLESRLAKEIHAKFGGSVNIYNEYGPTEATVGCMVHRFDPQENGINVPIGIAAANTQIYILDKYLQPVPSGVKGELFISGDGVAQGYLFNETLTKQKFIPDPFNKERVMYKTGDIARRSSSGIIEYIGRYDQQVKINGYRVELNEIEHHLASYTGVNESLVTIRTNKRNQKTLCAFYKSRETIEESAIRNYLAGRLPHYMIPVHYTRVEGIPLTKNGKINYDALPEPEINRQTTQQIPAKNKIEELSLTIWQDLLGEKGLQVSDNFFELGGDSIKAVQIASRLNEKGIAVMARDILTYQTIEQVSVHAKLSNTENRYEQHIIEGDKAFAPIESWFFENEFANPGFYNQSILLKYNKQLKTRLLETAFKKIIEHHDGLRLNYDPGKNLLYFNNKHVRDNFLIEEFEIGAGENTGYQLATLCHQLKKGFDITGSLLLKAAVIRKKDAAGMLFITAHHLVTDGISWRILLKDLYTAYNALENGELIRLSYKTASLAGWAKKVNDYILSASWAKEQEYWNITTRIKFAIPRDAETNDWRVENLCKQAGKLKKELTSFLLKDAHRVYKTDVPIILNTALAVTLKEWTRQNLFVIEQENHGRHLDDIDTSGTIGWFTAMYPVRLQLEDDSIGNQLKSVKEQIRNVPGHGIGYGAGRYNGNRFDETGKKMAEIRFNYLGQFDKELDNGLFTFCNEPHGPDVDPNNNMTAVLELNSMIIGGELALEISYNRNAHNQSTIGWFRDAYFNNLEKILEHIKNEPGMHFTPSDFDAVDLKQEELDALFR